MSSEQHDLTGHRYGGYSFKRLLGEGGYGAVWELENELGRKRAAKVLRRELLGNEEVVRRFLKEARTAAKIHHPNIVQVEDVTSLANGLPVIVMEYLEGETMFSLLRREGPLDPARAVPILLDICAAVGAAHDQNVVHRDLKPENIFFSTTRSREPVLKVLDFGIAKVLEDGQAATRRTRTGQVMGTAAYMSPEQVVGRVDIDARTDVYALGIIIFETLTGVLPFSASSITQWAIAHANESPRPLLSIRPELHRSWGTLIDVALAKDRNGRFSGMTEFAAALQAALAGRVVSGPAVVAAPVSKTKRARPAALRKNEDDASSPTGMRFPPGAVPIIVANPDDETLARPSPHISETSDAVPVAVHDQPLGTGPAESGTRRILDSEDSEVVRSAPSNAIRAGVADTPVQLPRTGSRALSKRTLLLTTIGLGTVVGAVLAVWAVTGQSSEVGPSAAGLLPTITLSTDAGTAKGPAMAAGILSDAALPADAAPQTDAAIADARLPIVADAAARTDARARKRVSGDAKKNKSKRKGSVKLSVHPWAEVYVDGRKMGQAPTTLRLPEGRHYLLLVNAAAKKRERLTIYVRADKTLVIRRSW